MFLSYYSRLLPVFLLTGMVLLGGESCTYRSKQQILNGLCDTSHVSYDQTVRVIMDDYCNSCHSGPTPSAGIHTQGYANVKTLVNNGQLWGTMNHDSGFKPMPQGLPKLDPCTLNKILAWVQQGAPNN